MKETPTMPEWSTVKTQMFNQKQEVVQDFIRITEALKLDSAEAQEFPKINSLPCKICRGRSFKQSKISF